MSSNAPEIGLGWRPETAQLVARRYRSGALAFTEVIAENHLPERLPPALTQLVSRGMTVIPHGVSLSLGGAAAPEPHRLERLARLAEALDAPFVSEHIAFVRAGSYDAGHLLPIALRHDALEVLIDNVRRAQRALPVPLVLENIATLFAWPDPELDEVELLTTLVAETGVGLLLDVSNLHANARNLGIDPHDYLARFPLGAVRYAHVAGGVERGGLYHDTHAHPVSSAPLALLATLAASRPGLPVLLERDDGFAGVGSLEAELDRVAAAIVAGEDVRRAS